HFSTNRNVLGFGFNMRSPIDGIGAGTRAVDRGRPAGPTITATIDLRDRPDVNDGIVIEDGVVPGGVARPFLQAIMASAAIFGKAPSLRPEQVLDAVERDLESIFEGPYKGALENTL